MTKKTAKDWCIQVKEALAKNGFPRTSKFNGGEVTGQTQSYGSTGFSVLKTKDDKRLLWHMVISGELHLKYMERRDFDGNDDGHEPINPNSISPNIKKVLEQELGIPILHVECCGWQTMWDDDVQYHFVTDPIEDMEFIRMSGWTNPYKERMPAVDTNPTMGL